MSVTKCNHTVPRKTLVKGGGGYARFKGIMTAFFRSFIEKENHKSCSGCEVVVSLSQKSCRQTLWACNSAARTDIKNLALYSISHLPETVQIK